MEDNWSDLPPDILSAIANLLNPTLSIIILRSVCHSWRHSLSPFSCSPPLPLNLPSSLSLHQHSTLFLSPPQTPSNGFFIKVSNINNNPNNVFTLLDPLTSSPVSCLRGTTINLLDYTLSLVSTSYALKWVGVDVDVEKRVPFKKVVVLRGFCKDGDFVVLGLGVDGGLFLWSLGDVDWTEIEANGRRFDDVISFNGRFYATADGKGRLVMIDSRRKPMDMVHSLVYGSGRCTHLVESEGGLYVVDDSEMGLGVYKLDEKGSFWENVVDLNGGVFFVGRVDNFVVSKKVDCGFSRDCVYYVVDCEEGMYHGVYDVKKNVNYLPMDSGPFDNLYKSVFSNVDVEE